MKPLYELARPFILQLEPERAHGLALKALAAGLHPVQKGPDPEALSTTVWGLNFPNPIGIAAGFDKNAKAPDALIRTGFGFAEVGTVTPQPQRGNPRPRVFRLIDDLAVINRLGFNNDGHDRVASRMAARTNSGGIVGVNIGVNKDSGDRHNDYALGVERFAQFSSYLTVNISSPNTPGLRDLQVRDELDRLLATVMEAREKTVQAGSPRRPIVLKIAPDVSDDGLKDIAEIAMHRAIDGAIVSNTTIQRRNLRSGGQAREQGGLSGKPLFGLSTTVLAKFYNQTEGQIPLIGVGGVDSGTSAFEKIRAGASLVQLYTAMVYHGPDLVQDIKTGLAELLAENGFTSVSDAVGTDAKAWAEKEELQ